jgi:hypothetical protein
MINSTNYKSLILTALNKATTLDCIEKVEDLIEDAWCLNLGQELNETLAPLEERMIAKRKELSTSETAEKAVVFVQKELDVTPVIEENTTEVTEVEVKLPTPTIEAPVVESTTTPREVVQMNKIAITASQKDIIETVLENFEIQGESNLRKTVFKFDNALGFALLARLERLVKLNKRSINSIMKKMRVALEGATPVVAPVEVVEVQVVEEKIEHIVPDSINPVEKPMNATQRRMRPSLVEMAGIEEKAEEPVEVQPVVAEEKKPRMTEEEIYQRGFDHLQREEENVQMPEPAPLFSPGFQERMAEKQRLREEANNRPVERKVNKRFEGLGFRLVDHVDNTPQPVATPVDMSEW